MVTGRGIENERNDERDEKEGLQKGLRKDLGVMDDEYVHYINCGNGFTDIHICQKLSNKFFFKEQQ